MTSGPPMEEKQLLQKDELWRHMDPHSTQMADFKRVIGKNHAVELRTYHELWQWSVDHPATFWEEVWKYTGVKEHQQYKTV